MAEQVVVIGVGVYGAAVAAELARRGAHLPADEIAGLRAASVESVRVGVRPIPGDGLPVLGRVPGLRNFHFAVSHSGATLSVHAGALVAGEVLGEDHSGELAAFRFERLAK